MPHQVIPTTQRNAVKWAAAYHTRPRRSHRSWVKMELGRRKILILGHSNLNGRGVKIDDTRLISV